PFLRPPPLRDRRRVAQPALARPADLRRGLAQQPPRVPDLGGARPAPVRAGAGPERAAHRRPRARRARLGRREDQRRAPVREARAGGALNSAQPRTTKAVATATASGTAKSRPGS